MTAPGFTTTIVHADKAFGVEHGAVHKPVHNSVQYSFDTVEDLIGMFQGTLKGAYSYSRQGTPTTAALEAKITKMEDGLGTVSFATGMAAIAALFLTLLRSGDHLLASQFVFGNTNSVFDTLRGLGVEVTTVDATDAKAVAAAVRPNTRMVFVETVANPGTQIADLEGIGALCKQHGLLYVIDNTILSPALFRAKTVGASIVMNALTKSIAGHGSALGGSLTDTGLFDWSRYPNIAASYRKGDPAQWGLQQIRKKGLRDMGGTLSSDHAHRIAMGAETLALRQSYASASTLALAEFLEKHPAIAKVNYSMLPSHPQHERAKKHFSAGSWLLSFELRKPEEMLAFINRLQLPLRATGLGDTRTLIIPVAPTIFWEAGAEVRAAMGIADGLVRLSVGLEETADLIADFTQALG